MADIVNIKSAAPSARLKKLDWGDKRASCRHKAVGIWVKEPILECDDCGAVVDAHQWIRDRCRDWDQIQSGLEFKRNEVKREIEELKKTLRLLRKEYKDERERLATERSIAILPPQRGTR